MPDVMAKIKKNPTSDVLVESTKRHAFLNSSQFILICNLNCPGIF